MDKKTNWACQRLTRALFGAYLFGFLAVLLVPGINIYELAIYGVTDNEFCGFGDNTILLGYEFPCNMEWRQIFLFGGGAWLFGMVLSSPIALLVVLFRDYILGNYLNNIQRNDMDKLTSRACPRLTRALYGACLFGFLTALLVPGIAMYQLARHGITDSDYCGIGPNTVMFWFEFPCHMDWQQIAHVGGIVWFLGTVLSFPIALFLVLPRGYLSKQK
jgi:hypothetical protein